MHEKVPNDTPKMGEDIGAAIELHESPKDKGAASKRSGLPTEPERLPEIDSQVLDRARSQQNEFERASAAEVQPPDTVQAQAVDRETKRSISTDLHIAEDNEPSEEQF